VPHRGAWGADGGEVPGEVHAQVGQEVSNHPLWPRQNVPIGPGSNMRQTKRCLAAYLGVTVVVAFLAVMLLR
jgi:hypothetical protein